MNTQASDNFVKEWKERKNPLRRAGTRFEKTFNTSAEHLFELLCPTKEYDWLPAWRCELLHTERGYAELGTVFKTRFLGPEEIWICTRYEPGKAICYHRVSENTCGKLEAALTGNAGGTATGAWEITVSALNESGNATVDALEASRAHLILLFDALAHYIDTGEMAA